MDITIVIQGATGLGIVGLLLERLRAFRRQNSGKESNGQRLDEIKQAISGLSRELKGLHSQSADIDKNVAIVRTEITAINSRCENHLDTQNQVNTNFKESLKCLDGRIFDLATKRAKRGT